jgi:hypothetical protein
MPVRVLVAVRVIVLVTMRVLVRVLMAMRVIVIMRMVVLVIVAVRRLVIVRAVVMMVPFSHQSLAQPRPWARSILAAAKAAPKPLSMFTTEMPDAHDVSMPSSAASPSNDAP